MSKVKLLLSALILIVVTAVATMSSFYIYLLNQYDMHRVIITAKREKTPYLASVISKIYLYSFRGTPEDIEYLQSSVGIMASFGFKDKAQDEKLFYFLLDKGFNINKANDIDGLYPLHEAIFWNNLDAVRLLLLNGADPTLEDKQFKLNSLDFTRKLNETRTKC